MSADSYTTQKTYIDANVDTNGVGSITGSIMNTALASYLLKNAPSMNYDSTRPYHADQLCFKITGNVYALYRANVDMVAGAFDSSKWDYLIGVETVTASITGTGSQAISHNLGVAPKIIHGEESGGALLELDVTARSATTFTIDAVVADANAKFHLITWGA